ncbi:MAG: hypothetical protein K8R21_09390 [Leptospira sp.]|nr:hypothetical protein [Leptospira sp.]
MNNGVPKLIRFKTPDHENAPLTSLILIYLTSSLLVYGFLVVAKGPFYSVLIQGLITGTVIQFIIFQIRFFIIREKQSNAVPKQLFFIFVSFVLNGTILGVVILKDWNLEFISGFFIAIIVNIFNIVFAVLLKYSSSESNKR